jgi:hypothetical protein
MKTKMKRYTLITGLCAVCLLLVILIGAQFQTDRPEDGNIPTQDDTAMDDTAVNIIIDIGEAATDSTPNDEPEIVVNPIKPADEGQGGAVSTGTEQTIQPDAVIPKPSEEQLADPTQTPDGVKVETLPPEALTDPDNKPPDAVIPAPTPNQPQHGDKRDGKIYIMGFGWIDDLGGGGEQIIADDMFENGNKIGIMG